MNDKPGAVQETVQPLSFCPDVGNGLTEELDIL